MNEVDYLDLIIRQTRITSFMVGFSIGVSVMTIISVILAILL